MQLKFSLTILSKLYMQVDTTDFIIFIMAFVI